MILRFLFLGLSNNVKEFLDTGFVFMAVKMTTEDKTIVKEGFLYY